MKQNNFFKIIILSSLILLSSCNREELSSKSEKNNVSIFDPTVKNGRLVFPDKESLNATYQALKAKKNTEVIAYIENKGINSLRPIITEENESEVISEIKQRKIALAKGKSSIVKLASLEVSNEDILEDLDDMEEIVGDDTYSAMLNGNAEIEVSGNIYKYTDVGLFITPVENYDKLENYLEVRKISNNMLVPTDVAVREQFIESAPSGEKISIAPGIEYFVAKEPPIDQGGGGGYVDTGTPPAEPSIATIIQNLPIGSVKKPLLGNLFGKTWVAYDKYEGRRRVKVKFYSQNLWLVYAVGCKVKHQYKGWTGLWRKENADKLGMGVNSISWTFSHPVTYAQGRPRQVYWIDGKMYKSADNTDYVNVGPATIPKLPFYNNSTVDAVVQFVTDFTGISNETLDKLFWETAWKQSNKFLEGQNKRLDRVAFIVDSYNSTYIRYYDFSQIENNQDVIERVFDWGVATPQITYTFGGGTSNGFDVTSYKFNLLKPEATAVNMYGIAKKNGGWHGVKLVVQ
jgi:hypothetical protein